MSINRRVDIKSYNMATTFIRCSVMLLIVGMGTEVCGKKFPGFWIPIPIPTPVVVTPPVVVAPTTAPTTTAPTTTATTVTTTTMAPCPAACCRTYCDPAGSTSVCDAANAGMCTDAPGTATPVAALGPCLDAATAGCDATTCAAATCVATVCPTAPAPVFCT